MKNNILFLSNNWIPSTFYDNKTELIWIFDYNLFINVYTNKIKLNNNINKKYAMHNDVYKSFLYKYNHSKKIKINNNKERKTKKKNKKKYYNKTKKN